ncbi:FecCD family ABC transporter permease [Chryseolinea lacunae]|uniref:FecCD family ABC transporter permease n=1 Tax=Chryseolinea lacunae TaxID=2801331 RepID=UPI001F1E27E8|nr:iron ABC transporter permease [Chryseolinea lacunae]
MNGKKSWILLPFLLGLLFVVNLGLGSVNIPPGAILSILTGHESANPVWHDIVWDFRMTKALTCLLAGSALSIAGLQMQTLFRNALAGPDVLGLSSGASLAVSLVFMSQAAGLHLFSTPGPWTVAGTASLGCFGVFFIVILIAQRLRDNTSLLIIGLMLGAATSSLVSVLQFLSKPEEQQSYMLWTFGSLGRLNWTEIKVLTIILVSAGLMTLFSTKALNGWLLGDHYAQSIGINLNRSRFIILFSTSVLTGGVTAFCGPIAFVGLAVPHLTKLIVKTHNHKILIPAVAVAGAALMLFCDIMTQLPGQAYVLPINAITAMIGAPVVIWIIIKAKRLAV